MDVFIGADNIVSPLGFSTEENFSAISSGKLALKPHKFSFSENNFYCARIDENLLESKFQAIESSSNFTRLEKMSILSIHDVVKSSGIDLSDKNNLLILSTTKGNIDLLENRTNQPLQEGVYLPAFAKKVADWFHCVNKPVVVSNACISGLLAMIIAKRMIAGKQYKNIVVCGADLVTEFTLSGFNSFNALSPEPCKPFDADRKGINLGEAAATVLLSDTKGSGIKLVAGASANDANHISGPSREGSGLFKAVSEVLEATGQASIDFISAHGTATDYNDEMESTAFSRAEINSLPVHSLKGYFGHTLGAAGVLESILGIVSLKKNILLRSEGYSRQGTTHLQNIISTTHSTPLNSFLKTASGFGGCNAAAFFQKIN